jgi:hypothetical protein
MLDDKGGAAQAWSPGSVLPRDPGPIPNILNNTLFCYAVLDYPRVIPAIHSIRDISSTLSHEVYWHYPLN